MSGPIFIDSFSGAVADLTAKQKRDHICVLRVLSNNPNVSTWDMDEDKLYRTIYYLRDNDFVAEIERPFPWHRFEITDKGKRYLAEHTTQ